MAGPGISTGSDGRFGPAGLVWRLTSRSPLKLYPLTLLLGVIALVLAGISLADKGLEAAVTTGSARLGADLMVVPAGAEAPLDAALIGGLPLKRLLPVGAAAQVTALPEVGQVAPQYFLQSAPADCCETGNLLLVAFDPARDFTVLPWLPPAAALPALEDELLIGGGVRKGKGAQLRLYNRSFRVVARLDKSGLGYFDNAAFIPLSGVAAMERSSRSGAVPLFVPWERPSLLLLKLRPGAEPRRTAAAIEQRVTGVRVLTTPELFRRERQQLERLAAVRRPLLVAGWFLALAAGGAVQLLYWRSRRRTLGLMLLWGYSRGELLRLFTLEALLLAAPAMAAGSLLAFALLRLTAGSPGQSPALPLLLDSRVLTAAGIPGLCFVFAVGMAAEAFGIVFWLLRRDAAVLLRDD